MKRRAVLMSVGLAGWLWFAAAAPASACPMCKLATESTSRQPRAYMYSVLFMMGMPAMLTAGFGFSFYRLSRKSVRMQLEALELLAAAEQPQTPGDGNLSSERNVGGETGPIPAPA